VVIRMILNEKVVSLDDCLQCKVDMSSVIGFSYITRSVIGQWEGMEHWYLFSLSKSLRGDRGGHFDLLGLIRVGRMKLF
jgi:hypothetical protein